MTEKQARLTHFLMDEKYSLRRSLLFVLIGTVLTSSMVYVAYMDCIPQLGNRIFLLCLTSCVGYAAAMLWNYYYLIPQFLLRGRYVIYFLVLFATAYLLPTLAVIQEYFVRNAWGLPHRITSYTSPLIAIDNLSSCMLLLVCFLGVSALMFFRQWKIQEEQLSRMEYEHLQSEVNKLKGQLTPSFLSTSLQNTAHFVNKDPHKAHEILMQLGTLLRYQLYDCNRENVLLNSEINHLRSFLRIEQLIHESFTYQIRTEGNLSAILIPPLLFITLIQEIARTGTDLRICFTHRDHTLSFSCLYGSAQALPEAGMASFRKRLNLQFPGAYEWVSGSGKTELKIDLP